MHIAFSDHWSELGPHRIEGVADVPVERLRNLPMA
jgi:hypothetical protein